MLASLYTIFQLDSLVFSPFLDWGHVFWARIPQNNMLFLIHHTKKHMVLIILVIGDVHFDLLGWCLPGFSTVQLILFPL